MISLFVITIEPHDPISISKISWQGQILKDMNWAFFASAEMWANKHRIIYSSTMQEHNILRSNNNNYQGNIVIQKENPAPYLGLHSWNKVYVLT